jgi:WS/DGAT/MGAT family acyltransferase
MRRLTGLDATFLFIETPSNHMHVASVAVFDPSTVPGGYTFEKVRALVENRLPLLPPFRWKLVEVPFGLHRPLFIEDPDFDLDFHIRRCALPSPGGADELRAFVADVAGRPLDRSRPLWEMYVIEGLEGGRIAIVTKTHHAAIDGVSGMELTVNLLDLGPEPEVLPAEDPPWKPDRRPSDVEMVAYAAWSLARQPLLAAQALRRTTLVALNLWRRNRLPNVRPQPAPFAAPRTSLNVAITPHRVFGMTRLALHDIKLVKNTVGGTVNDVVLAVCAGALRRYFEARGERHDTPLVAMAPVSLRTDGDRGTMGNQVSAMLVSLATDVDDPLGRLAAIQRATAEAKDQERAVSASELTDWTEFAAPAVAARAARLVSSLRVLERRPIFNVVISNVPGPDVPLYSAGARLEEIYPVAPINDGVALNITVMSYLGRVHFGLLACRETMPEVQQVAGYINDALEELLAAAGRVSTAPDPASRG